MLISAVAPTAHAVESSIKPIEPPLISVGRQPRKRKIEEVFEEDEIEVQDKESVYSDSDCIIVAARK